MADKQPTGGTNGVNKKKTLLLAAAAGIVLLLVGVIAGVMLGGGKENTAAVESAGPPPAIYTALGEKFLVELQHEGKQRYFQVSISAMSRDEAVVQALDTHAPLIRGRLVSLLGQQDFSRLRTREGKVALREQALALVQDLLEAETGNRGVEQIFFTEFVLQ